MGLRQTPSELAQRDVVLAVRDLRPALITAASLGELARVPDHPAGKSDAISTPARAVFTSSAFDAPGDRRGGHDPERRDGGDGDDDSG